MRKEKVSILSIDFDFFQIVDEGTLLTCYPDGIDVSTNISKITWSGYYVTPGLSDRLKRVQCDKNKLDQIKKIIAKCKNTKNIKIANSHCEIYPFIHNLMEKYKTSNLDVVNVDMHHDITNDNTDVDCGNWLGRIAEEYNTNITWISNPISKKMFGLTSDKFNVIGTDLNVINPTVIDAIFICRSDNWTPPHLDDDFHDLLESVKKSFPDGEKCELLGETCILTPRDMSEFIDFQIKVREWEANCFSKQTKNKIGLANADPTV